MNKTRKSFSIFFFIALAAAFIAAALLFFKQKSEPQKETTEKSQPAFPPPQTLPDFYADNPAPVLTMVGDIHLGARGLTVVEKKGYRYPFERVRWLLIGDIIIGNQEAPITDREELLDEKKLWNARQSPKSVSALKEEGFSLLSLANNHMLDYRLEGAKDTVSRLEAAGIKWCGFDGYPNKPDEGRIIEARGVKIGFLCYQTMLGLSPNFWKKWDWFSEEGKNAGVPLMTAERLLKDIDRLRNEKGAQIIAVIVHWGEDYEQATEKQKELGRIAIEAGADIIAGHHSHIPQTVEIYKGKPIIYGLGNFAFLSGGRFNKKGLQHLAFGLAAHIKVDATGWLWIRLTPLWINNREKQVRYRARPATPEQAAALFEEILTKQNPALKWQLEGITAVINPGQTP